MPRLVRRAPLRERLKAYLDPYDFLLWLSEELNDDAYDDWLNEWATPIAIGLNLQFILARGASRPGSQSARDDVFGDPDGRNGSGWFAWVAAFVVQALTLLCCANTLYTFLRKRHYRLFEHSVDDAPPTPSAHRVQVDDSAASVSPFRFIQNVLTPTTARSRAHPDPKRDVWELRVWDPKPFNLKIFTLFSPGHALLYFSLLPPATLDPRPSVTVLTAIAFGALLSLQLVFLRTSFGQQAKDKALVHGEVMHEYNTKYVHPSLNHPVRDVGTQTREASASSRETHPREVDVYQPTTIIKRGFEVHPNPNYANLYDPNNGLSAPHESRRQSFAPSNRATPSSTTPSTNYADAQTQLTHKSSVTGGSDFSSPLKQHHDRLERSKSRRRDGGNLGIYDHVASPLRKATSSSHLEATRGGTEKRSSAASGRAYTSQEPGSNGTADPGRRRVTGRY